MKNLILTLFLISPMLLSAQYSKPTRIFGKGQVDVQAAVGMFPTYIADHPEPIVPPLHLSVRWMVARQVSLSAFTGYSTCRSREELAFDNTRGIESIAMSFIVNRPTNEPGFGLVRQEVDGRSIRYTIHSYATDKPETQRY